MRTAISWFEIPCTDLDRAQAFYETVLARTLRREDFGGNPLAVFPYDDPATGGCLLTVPAPASASTGGVRIYLDCSPSLDDVLARIEDAGGKVALGRTALPPGMGVIAEMHDTEGNRIGLHAPA